MLQFLREHTKHTPAKGKKPVLLADTHRSRATRSEAENIVSLRIKS